MLDDTIGGAAVLDSGGDVGAVDTPEVSSEVVTPETPEITSPEQQEQQPSEGQSQFFDTQGKITLQGLKAGFEKLNEVDKKVAGEIRSGYFENKQFKSSFATPQQAREAKETLDVLGGQEGIEQLQQERQEYARELTMFAEANPELLRHLHADSPNSIGKLTPYALDILAQSNPEIHDSVVLDGFNRTLQRSGFPDGLNTLAAGTAELVDHIQNGRQQEAFNAARNIAAWMQKFKSQMGTARPQATEPDERMQRVEQKEKELQSIEENNYRHSVNSQLNQEVIKPLLNRALAPLMKGRTLTVQQKQRLETMIYNDITREVQADKRFQDKRRALGERHDTKGLMNLFRPRMEEIIPKVVKSVWSDSGFASAAPKAAGNGNAPQIQVGQKPRAEDIDWTKDKNRMRFMSGEATLKNGKIARWKWENV